MPTFESKIIKVFGQYSFYKVTSIELKHDAYGRVQEFMPQSRYNNRKYLALHKYGGGPFCGFRIERNVVFQGVYIITKNEYVVYIGECQNLASRFNNGYGQISPRNCYENGQRTNCKINRLIMKSIVTGNKIDLWFLKTYGDKSTRKEIEAELRAQYKPTWNGEVNLD